MAEAGSLFPKSDDEADDWTNHPNKWRKANAALTDRANFKLWTNYEVQIEIDKCRDGSPKYGNLMGLPSMSKVLPLPGPNQKEIKL